MSDDDEAGYGRPPKKNQFKKGQSGNPKGRPKGRESIRRLVTKEMSQTLKVTENGEERRLSKREALVKTTVARAMNGDQKARDWITARDEESGFIDHQAYNEYMRENEGQLAEDAREKLLQVVMKHKRASERRIFGELGSDTNFGKFASAEERDRVWEIMNDESVEDYLARQKALKGKKS